MGIRRALLAPAGTEAAERKRSRVIPEADVRRLWAYSGNTCAYRYGSEICVQELVERPSGINVGHTAHIVGLNPDSARHSKHIRDIRKLNGYDNLILLCATHHTKIDHGGARSRYSVRCVRKMKEDHEAWMAQQRSLLTGGSGSGRSVLMAEFRMDPDSDPNRPQPDCDRIRGVRHHYVTLWVANPPPGVRKIRYRLHPTFPKPAITIWKSPHRLAELQTYGDFTVRAEALSARGEVAVQDSISRALRRNYGRKATGPVLSAIRTIERG